MPQTRERTIFRKVCLVRPGSRVVQGVGEEPAEPDALVESADRQQPGIAEESARPPPDHERRAEEIEDL
jgi:hypothetical protein